MPTPAPQPSGETAYNGSMKILVIEDDREAADYLQKAFTEAGHTAHVAGDGETGFALADSGDYDVMVVDRMMPRRDGLSVIAQSAEPSVNTTSAAQNVRLAPKRSATQPLTGMKIARLSR